MTRLTQAQEAIREKARELAEAVIAPRAAEVDRQEAYPWDNCRALCEAGFFGMTLPREYGGPGLGFLEVALVIEEMARVCDVTGRIAVEANTGAVTAIMAYGSEAPKQLTARPVLADTKQVVCITEPARGSDASDMHTPPTRQGHPN